MKFTSKIVFLWLLAGCNDDSAHDECATYKIGIRQSPVALKGKWTFIQISDSAHTYAEAIFQSDSTLILKSEQHGKIGPLKYATKAQSVHIENDIYNLIIVNSKALRLTGNGEQIYLYKILFDEDSLNKNQIDPYYLRRCYYLVHLNLITMNDALRYLEDVILSPVDSTILEESIPL